MRAPSPVWIAWVSLAVSLAGGQSLAAFVVNINDNGIARRWDLEGTTPGVHTNSVNPATKSIRYFISSEAFSIANRAAEIESVRASFDQWQSIPGTALRFEDGGTVGVGADVNLADGTNVVFWTKATTLVNGGRDSVSGTLAMTYARVNSANVLLEADIAVNGTELDWQTDLDATNSPAYFVEATLLHEIGHFIGLEHSPVGGATMFARGGAGISLQTGLSADELAAARQLYPTSETMTQFGSIKGRAVFDTGEAVFGAAVIAEEQSGNAVVGTMTDRDGRYELPALEIGEYRVRVAPLDPPVREALARLISGSDISSAFNEAITDFFPATTNAIVRAGESVSLDIAIRRGVPGIRISRIRGPSYDETQWSAINAPVRVPLGVIGLLVGVYTPDELSPAATLTVTGTGVAAGAPKIIRNAFEGTNPALQLISVPITISNDAAPGLRSFVLTDGGQVAYANGFLEIAPMVVDDNFDGLDDRFQRRFFSRFTSPAAMPSTDPDGDGFSNRAEQIAGTVPTDAGSALRIEQVTWSRTGAVVRWQSVAGKSYQLLRRRAVEGIAWEAVGAPVVASGSIAEARDPNAEDETGFYRVLVVE